VVPVVNALPLLSVAVAVVVVVSPEELPEDCWANAGPRTRSAAGRQALARHSFHIFIPPQGAHDRTQMCAVGAIIPPLGVGRHDFRTKDHVLERTDPGGAAAHTARLGPFPPG